MISTKWLLLAGTAALTLASAACAHATSSLQHGMTLVQAAPPAQEGEKKSEKPKGKEEHHPPKAAPVQSKPPEKPAAPPREVPNPAAPGAQHHNAPKPPAPAAQPHEQPKPAAPAARGVEPAKPAGPAAKEPSKSPAPAPQHHEVPKAPAGAAKHQEGPKPAAPAAHGHEHTNPAIPSTKEPPNSPASATQHHEPPKPPAPAAQHTDEAKPAAPAGHHHELTSPAGPGTKEPLSPPAPGAQQHTVPSSAPPAAVQNQVPKTPPAGQQTTPAPDKRHNLHREEHQDRGNALQPGTTPQPAGTQVPTAQPTAPEKPSAETAPTAAPNTKAPTMTAPNGAAPSAPQAAKVPAPAPQTPAAALAPPQAPKTAQQFIRKDNNQTAPTMKDIRQERKEVREGNRTVIIEGDRTIVKQDNRVIIRHNEAQRFAVGARAVDVRREGNETTTVVVRPDGDRIINVTDDSGHLIRRVRRERDGREIVIIDEGFAGPRREDVFVQLPPPMIQIPRERYIVEAGDAQPDVIYEVLDAPPVERIEHRYTIDQVRYSAPLRERMPRLDLDINFDTGSWQLTPDQIDKLSVVADGLKRAIRKNPREVFLIEGHTDAVGSEEDNLSLSDRRAESVAVALTEQLKVPPENLVTQGYGEQNLKVQTQEASRANRRVSVRRITPLIDRQARR